MNIEVIIGRDGNVYFIEMGPRNGGNLIPDLLRTITGIDLIKATVEFSLGNQEMNFKFNPKEEFYSMYTIHSLEQGKLMDILYKKEIKENIIFKVIYKEKGDEIDVFNSGNKAIGFVFLKFDSLEEQQYKMRNMSQYIHVQVKEEKPCLI